MRQGCAAGAALPGISAVPPTLPGDHLDTTIGSTFLPGIKHGICHRRASTDHLIPECIADEFHGSEVGDSCRLRLAVSAPGAEIAACRTQQDLGMFIITVKNRHISSPTCCLLDRLRVPPEPQSETDAASHAAVPVEAE